MDLTWALGVFVLANFAAACSGGIFRPGAWYRALAKPSWQPPDWLFAPVWSVLYIMIAVAGWRVWESAHAGGLAVPMAIYGVQLVLNAGWSALFFGMKRMDLAFAEVIALWLSIVATMAAFWPIDPLSGWLLVPYLLWVSFAAFLNWTVWRLNPDASGERV